MGRLQRNGKCRVEVKDFPLVVSVVEQKVMEFRKQELFKQRTLRSSGPEWLYAPLERTGADTNSDGTVLACYKERLVAPAGLGAHIVQAAGRLRPASAASSRGKAESQRQRPKTARQFRDTKTRARQSPAFMKGTESSKLKATSLQCTGLSLSARAHPSHSDAPTKLHRAAARLLEAQHSKHNKPNSSRSSRPQSAPFRPAAGHLRYNTATPSPRCPFAQLQQAVQKDIHTLSMDHTLPKVPPPHHICAVITTDRIVRLSPVYLQPVGI